MNQTEVIGKKVVLTGKFTEFKRTEAEAALESLGALVTKSISSKTDILFVGEKAGSKLAKAMSLGITVIDESTLSALLADVSVESAKPKSTENAKKVKTGNSVGRFAGKTIVLTGTFVTMKRAEAKGVLQEAGAKVSGSISSKTDILVYGEKAGSKLTKAKTLGVELMTELEMVEILQASGAGSDQLAGATEKLAAATAAQDKAMEGPQAIIDEANASFVKTHGATLGSLLLTYLRIFEQRPDIHVYGKSLGAPASSSILRQQQTNIPAEMLALSQEVGKIEFNWVFDEHKAEQDSYSHGYNGGRVALQGLDGLRWWPIADWQKEYESFECESVFDEFVAEGITKFSYNPGQARTEAELIFDDANDCERHPLASVFGYLTAGAKAGFTWYWQNGAGEFTDQLLASSLPKATSKETIRDLLIAKDIEAVQADALMSWLGDDVVVLLHLSETPEGKAAVALEKSFPLSSQQSVRTMDIEMIESLGSSADPSQDEFDAKVMEHGKFLDSGGRGGAWMLLSAAGLPLNMYQGAAGSEGEQFVGRLTNVTGLDAEGVELEWADISGIYATNINLKGAKLSNSVITDSILNGASFESAILHNVDFSGTRLIGASFKNADLTGADFECCDLTDADFTGAKMDGSRFPGATLKGAKKP